MTEPETREESFEDIYEEHRQLVKTTNECLDQIEQYIDEYRRLEAKGKAESLRIGRKLIASVITLRSLNRDLYLVDNEFKLKVSQCRDNLDKNELEAINRQYQISDLKKNIQIQDSYPLNLDDLDLTPLDEFLKDHPDLKDSSDLQISRNNCQLRNRNSHS
ncbi:hypothetical protein CANCADRAFT_59203 [Tortispora caseinolytica NRRL Y-17796]|uniref:Uncharacterized protein n=1 Tax=Tortispora caseinolytica NRRL Y-17796 TaxID=767744 RepID=A0A1E4TJH0_9ASCO|nr:hypothetical protein CANCADRAFT_59203 [Tortispora caseinolytica NRRL Y-17796]